MRRTSSENVGLLGKESKLDKQPVLGEYLTRAVGSRGMAGLGMTQQGGSQENNTPDFLHLPTCISCWCFSLAEARGKGA